MDKVTVSGEFIALPSGQVFSVSATAHGPSDGVLVVVPPFAEEMNKSRKMMNLLLRACATKGCSAYLLDLFGTGDSEGEFGEATWTRWKDNLLEYVDELKQRYPESRLHFVALRTGALLLNDMLSDCERPWVSDIEFIHYWNPVFNANQYLSQFLRMRLAADMMRSEGEKVTVKDLRAQIDDLGSIEVAGYELNQALVSGMEQADIKLPQSLGACNLCFYELSSMGRITPGLAKGIEKVVCDDQNHQSQAIVGPQFWSTQEIALCPELLQSTTLTFRQSDEVPNG